VKYLIPKPTLKAQVKRIQKSQPGLTVDGARQIIKDGADRDKAEKTAAIYKFNVKLKDLGFGVKRGLFMETPLGMVDGKMKFNWGRMLHYAGIGQERVGPDGRGFDGEGGFRGDGLLTAEVYAHAHDLYRRYLLWGKEPIGQKARICPGCHRPFVGRNQAKTCSSKCRKRLERSLKAKALQDVTVSP
jgi:hypothetical protein